MTKVLITGGQGFLGRNLAQHLSERKDVVLWVLDRQTSEESLRKWASEADIVFHLAGINRPKHEAEFGTGNVGLTGQLCQMLKEAHRAPKIVFSSTVQAELDNPYGVSKRGAEEILRKFGEETGAEIRIYRLRNLFGKWGRPNYNSVTATFCYKIARDLPISVSDASAKVHLSYVDDVVVAFLGELESSRTAQNPGAEIPVYSIELGDLAGRIQAFHDMRNTLRLPDFSDWFNRALYATYLSFVPEGERLNGLKIISDARGSLAEFIKGEHFGQIFVSRTKAGVTRGNHYHHTKTEKFFVVEGEGMIRMRAVAEETVQEYRVSGADYQVIDIPPGVTHSITNVGTTEMVTLFWASEVFDVNRPDTYFLPVDLETPAASPSMVRA